MQEDKPEKLSEIDVNIHGYTSDDVIENRKAAMKLVEQQAIKGDEIALKTMWLDTQAKLMGKNMDYDEDLDDDMDI